MLTGAAWDLEAVRGDVLECDASRGELSADLRDLEPRSGAVVAGGAAGGLGEVDAGWAWVVGSLVQSKADSVASLDGCGLGFRSGAETSNVATEVVGLDVGDGGVVVGVHADILVWLGGLAVQDEFIPAVCGVLEWMDNVERGWGGGLIQWAETASVKMAAPARIGRATFMIARFDSSF